LRAGRKIEAARPATVQQTMPGSVRQPTRPKTMTQPDLEVLAGNGVDAVMFSMNPEN